MAGGNFLTRLLSPNAGGIEPAPMRYQAEARLYEYEGRYFICSVSGISETNSLTVLDAACEDEEAGKAILQHLAEFSPEDVDQNDYRRTDWPAFQASGAKSVKSFETGLWHVNLAIMNSAVMIWAAPRLTLKDNDLSVYASSNRHFPQSVGSALRSALSAAKLLHESGGF